MSATYWGGGGRSRPPPSGFPDEPEKLVALKDVLPWNLFVSLLLWEENFHNHEITDHEGCCDGCSLHRTWQV
jgi:hypothetical protein